jgi:hypothetical protein
LRNVALRSDLGFLGVVCSLLCLMFSLFLSFQLCIEYG